MVEKHFDDYINLPFLDPLYFDDGGRRDSLEKSVNWKAKGFERYCVSSSIRGSRALPDDLREVALRIIKYFSNLQPAQVASPSDKTGG